MIEKLKNWLNYRSFGPISSMSDYLRYRRSFRKEAPIRYFIVNFTGTVSGFFGRISMKLQDFILFNTLLNRSVVRTGLKNGPIEQSDLFLHACFSLLVEKVETHWALEKQFIDPSEDFPLWRQKAWSGLSYTNLLKYRDPATGLEWIDREISWYYDELAIEELKEIRFLYLWWTVNRPNRKIAEVPNFDDQGCGLLSDRFNRNATDYQEYLRVSLMNDQILHHWYIEDKEMLERLIKVHQRL